MNATLHSSIITLNAIQLNELFAIKKISYYNAIVIHKRKNTIRHEFDSHHATQAKSPSRVVFADRKVCITNTTGLGQP